MMGDADRGYVLEIMLAKLLYVASERVQIICLSATVPNISDLAAWLNADLYVTNFRPIPLTEFVVSGGQVRDLYTYIHIYIYTYMHVSIHTYDTYIHTYMHTYIHSYKHTYIHTNVVTVFLT